MNFSNITSNNPPLVLHFSCSMSFKVWTNLSLSQPYEFYITRTFLHFSILKLLVMKMFFTFILQLCNSWYVSATFQSNIACFNIRLPDVGAICTGLALLTRLFAPSMAIMATLAGSITACIIAFFVICSAAILALFLDCFVWVCLYILYLSLSCVKLLASYFWYHVMLLTLKEGNIIGSLNLCHLFCMFSWIVIYDFICTGVCLYATTICKDGALMDMFLCLLLVAICSLCHWPGIYYFCCASTWILCNYGCIYVDVDVLILSLHCACSWFTHTWCTLTRYRRKHNGH